MKCEHYTYSPEQEVDSSQTLSLGIPQSPPSSGTPTPAQPSDPVQPMDGSPACMCTREIFGCSNHPNTPAEWIAYMRDSLVRILALQEKERELQELEAASIPKSCEQLTLFALDLFTSKTPLPYAPEAGMWYLANWWREDTPTVTESLPRLMLEPITGGIDGGAWLPTPTTQDNNQIKGKGKRGTTLGGPNQRDSKGNLALPAYAAQYPTPKSRDFRTGDKTKGSLRRMRKSKPGAIGPDLNDVVAPGGQLNPPWVAWLMGWPLGHTKLNASEMDKYLSARRRRGNSSEARK